MSNKTWVVVADGAHARVLRYRGPVEPLEPVSDGVMEQSNEKTSELVRNKRGRVFQSADGTPSAMEDSSDAQDVEKRRFAGRVAEFLQQNQDQYDSLVLAAAPKTLGEIRQKLSGSAHRKITAELDKDLTGIDNRDLPKHLQKVINIQIPR